MVCHALVQELIPKGIPEAAYVCSLTQLLMLIAFLPSIIRNPLKHIISKLELPMSRELLVACGVVLLAALVDSYLKAKVCGCRVTVRT